MKEYQHEDYIKYRIKRARETIEEVKIQIDHRLWNTAINRMYYACYYAIGALLAKHQIIVSSHHGLRQKFGEYFVKTEIFDKKLAKHFTELFDKRNKGDYNDFFDFDEETILKLYPVSKDFVAKAEELLSD